MSINQNFSINVEPQNILITDNKLQLIVYSTLASVKSTTYNGEKCYAITNFNGISNVFYLNAETGLQSLTQNGTAEKWSLSEYVYEFDTVTESDFTEPDISDYEEV